MLARGEGRRVLCVFPRYTPSFGTFEFAYPLTDGVRAFMPPQGLLVIAAAVPPTLGGPLHRREHRAGHRRRFRLGRCGVRQRHACPAAADATTSAARAHAFGKVAVLGGSVGVGLPGELSGLRLPARRRDRRRHRRAVRAARRETSRGPPRQIVLTTKERRALTEFPDAGLRAGADRPLSARQHPVLQRLSVSVRVLRHPRALRPRRALQDARAGLRRARQARRLRPDPPSVYFVDDNFIANRKRAVREMLPHLDRVAEAQRLSAAAVACEATLNIAKRPEILELMREADVHDDLLRHRDAGARGAEGDVEGAQHDGAAARLHRNPQRLRHGGRVRHHHGPRHRHAPTPASGCSSSSSSRRSRC